jgi:hypothetical protein
MFVGKLWTAPDILRENFPPPRGTQKGDVYSFAIICYEIMMRSEPFSFDHMTARGQSSHLVGINQESRQITATIKLFAFHAVFQAFQA